MFYSAQSCALREVSLFYAVIETNMGIIRDTKYSKIACVSRGFSYDSGWSELAHVESRGNNSKIWLQQTLG